VSGALDDGSAGLRAIAEHGGRAFVQDPSEAAIRDMPAHAIAAVPRAVVATVAEIGARLAWWCHAEEPVQDDDGLSARGADPPSALAKGPAT
jgi:chemotaxis response regulator CheB